MIQQLCLWLIIVQNGSLWSAYNRHTPICILAIFFPIAQIRSSNQETSPQSSFKISTVQLARPIPQYNINFN